MVQIFTKQKYVPRNWSEVVFRGGGFMIVVEEWGVGDGGGTRWAYIWTRRAFLFL